MHAGGEAARNIRPPVTIIRKDAWPRQSFLLALPARAFAQLESPGAIGKILDLPWLAETVGEKYCETNGRPSIDPEAALRLMLTDFFLGLVHDRKLMRDAQVNIASRTA